MKHHKNTCLYCCIAALFSILSCTKEDTEFRLHLEYERAAPGTRSSMGINDDATLSGGINVFCFDTNDLLIAREFFSDGSDLSLTLPQGRYTFFLVANTIDLTERVSTLQQAMDLEIAIPSDIVPGTVPMSTRKEVFVQGGSCGEVFFLKRMFARYSLRMDKSSIPRGASFAIRSLASHCTSESVMAFSDNMKVSAVVTLGDQCSKADIDKLDKGEEITLYIPENIQGTEPGIDKPQNKIPDFPYKNVNIASCTFIEIFGTYTDENHTSYDVTYRMYLGANNTNDFNIERNRQYNITFIPERLDSGHVWWKCEPVVHTDYSLTISPSPASVIVGNSTSLKAVYSTYSYGTLVSSEDVTGACSWSSDNSSIVSVSAGLISGKNIGSTTVRASYGWRSSSTAVTVEPVPHVYEYRLKMTMDKTFFLPGDEITFNAIMDTYCDGVLTSSRDVSDQTSLQYSSRAFRKVGNRYFAYSKGIYTLHAVYQGVISNGVDIKIIQSEVKVTPEVMYLKVGETKRFTADYYIYNYGEEPVITRDMMNRATWTVLSGEDHVRKYNTGAFYGISPGETEVKVTIVSDTYTTVKVIVTE